jgi:phosphatidate cytidylyltransferase
VNNLITRTLTGIIFVAAIIGSMIWHPLAFGILFFMVMLMGMEELYRMAGKDAVSVPKRSVLFISSLIYMILMLLANRLIPVSWFASIPVLLLAFFILELFRKAGDPVKNVSYSILSVVYVTIPFASLNFFFNPDFQGLGSSTYFLLLGYFLLLWSHDIFAYLTGLVFGRHKLFKRVSPNKTWEGSLGGVIFSLLMAWGLSYFIWYLNILEWMGMALIIAVFGTLGDLSESMLKRKYDVKDSGTILPGHGGILDRFDAMMFSAPAVLCYLVILQL